MPIALWSPVTSGFCGMNATVTSPGEPCGASAGREIRYMVELNLLRDSSYFEKVMSFSASKCFHPFMTFAAPGSARIRVFPPTWGSWVRVSLWQWSDFACEMITRSGSGRSLRFEM